MTDDQFFETFPDRQCRLREPLGVEYFKEFQSLGDHKKDRERILVWKVPKDNALGAGMLIRLPFLAFADEEIADRDEVLLPILDSIMVNAADALGVKRPTRF